MVVGCGGGAEPAGRVERVERMERVERGALVLDIPLEATQESIDVQIANAIELLQSRRLVERVIEAERLERVLGGDKQDRAVAVQAIQQAIRVSRRGDSTLIDIGIADSVDPLAAVTACNRLMQVFVQYRLQERAGHDDQTRRARLESELVALERAGSAADPRYSQVTQHLLELELERDRDREQLRNDVRILDPCRIRPQKDRR